MFVLQHAENLHCALLELELILTYLRQKSEGIICHQLQSQLYQFHDKQQSTKNLVQTCHDNSEKSRSQYIISDVDEILQWNPLRLSLHETM